MPRLDFYSGYELQTSIKLGENEVTIGRDPACIVQLPDARVSRLHAKILSTDGGHEIDNHGGNGTKVNGNTIAAPHNLKPGDAIFISSYILVYQPDDAPVQELDSTVLAF